MKKTILTGAFMLCCLLAAAQEESKKVAVFDPAGDVENAIKEIVREEISSVIVNTDGFTVLERQLISKVLEENKFQMGGLVDDSQISEIGRRMGADYVFVSIVTELGRNYYVSCKMIEVLTARIERQKTASTRKGLDDLMETVQGMVGAMFGQNPSQQKPKRAATVERQAQQTISVFFP